VGGDLQVTEAPLGAGQQVERVVMAFIRAVGAQDLDAVAMTLGREVSWSNVPHPATLGRRAVVDMLGAVIGRAERVSWEVVSASYAADRVHLERLDRFWIGGVEYAVACHGVFRVDVPSGQIVEVRDYVDLGEWRSRLSQAGRSIITDD
jgi:limonene-1,2-epoxide hydrolase